jgi:hypothetical protein
MSTLDYLNKEYLKRFYSVATVKVSAKKLATMSFAERMEHIKKLEAFKLLPETKVGWVRLKGCKNPETPVKEFVRLNKATQFYTCFPWEDNYRHDSVEIFYQTQEQESH